MKLILGYIKDSNAAAHSVYSEFKVVSYHEESVLVYINFMHDDTSMTRSRGRDEKAHDLNHAGWDIK